MLYRLCAGQDLADMPDRGLEPTPDMLGRGFNLIQPRRRALEFDREAGSVVLHQLQFCLEVTPERTEARPGCRGGFELRHRRIEPPNGGLELG